MALEVNDEEVKRLAKIGAVMDSIGISTVELAERLKEHVSGCPGGKNCITKLLNPGSEE